MTKAKRISPGDTVAIVSPSWGGPSVFPKVHENGIRILQEKLGLKVKEFPTARMDARELYLNPKKRADDLNNAFGDPEIKGIIASIGGNDSVRILQYLDVDKILKNPKLIMGYSDSTAFLAYLNMKGLGTFYGPSTMTGFSYLENFPDTATEYRRFLFEDSKIAIAPFKAWTDKYLEWNNPGSTGKVDRIHTENVGHHWINKGPASRGKLWGGCFEVLEMMKATFAWPSPDFWADRVLFLETSEDKPTPEQVGYGLRNYGVQGVLTKIKGLLIGRPKSYSPDEKEKLEKEVLKVVVGEFGRSDLNIVTNLDFGHTDPRHILPFGIEMGLDPGREELKLLEEAFED